MNFTDFVRMFRSNIIGQTKVSMEDGSVYSDLITGRLQLSILFYCSRHKLWS